jgi:hypothetical protein
MMMHTACAILTAESEGMLVTIAEVWFHYLLCPSTSSTTTFSPVASFYSRGSNACATDPGGILSSLLSTSRELGSTIVSS